jgi:imidazolonepropionase-like amidohydrolase
MRGGFEKWVASLVTACSLVWLASTAVAQAMALPQRQVVAITGATVIDVERGRSIGPRTVLVDDGRIVAIVAPRDANITASAQRVDGRGRFLIPGLVDMHFQLLNK